MPEIKVNKKSEEENKWIFEVLVDNSAFMVEVEKGYWQKLTQGTRPPRLSEQARDPARHARARRLRAGGGQGNISPEELVKKSFDFLLAREPKESILRSFNLKVISDYFPEYEGEIGK